MFFFFADGLEQQASKVLKSGAGRCINCGSMADLVEYDNVLKIFFVPVWKWPGKDPAMYCNNCKFMFPNFFSLSPPSKPDSVTSSVVSESLRCRFCDQVVESRFRFCPFCGSSL
ncbi:uncharacterized protein [Euphorbia lathyris]|uniref:uncharacterized protein n=1 Tax=Euphorbia lathyris TaxID=212925 RepID=UPI00331321D0